MNAWWIDGGVIAVYFVVIVGIGLWAARGQRSLETFALGGRSMPWWAVLASILASEISAGTFLGTPGEGFNKRNFTYALLAIGTVVARMIVAGVFIKPFYEMRVVSIYEYLEQRFGVLTKRLASAVFLLTRSLASGSRIFVAAILIVLAYEQWHGLHLDVANAADRGTLFWIYFWAVVGITAVTTLYTALGGIKAVVWTDLIQVTLMFGAAVYVFVWLWGRVGGYEAFAGALKEPLFWDTGLVRDAEGRVTGPVWGHVKNVLSSEYTVWAAFLGSVFTTLATHGTDQDMVQRMLTATDQKRSRWAVIGSGLVDVPVVCGFLAIGVLLHVYYTQVDAQGLPADARANVFPWFMVHDLGPGVRGLLAAGLFATAMGSLSTALNALATSFTRDWYVGVLRPQAGEREQFNAARWSTVGFAVALALVGIGTAVLKLVNPELRIIPIVLGSFGYTYGSLLGVFLLGMLTKTRGNCRGNLVAMAAGLIAVAVLSGAHNDVWDIMHEKEARVRNAVKVLQVQVVDGRIPAADLARVGTRARLAPAEVERVWSHPNARHPLFQPDWLPTLAFTWRIMAGAVVTFLVGACFRSRSSPGPGGG